MHSGPHAWSSWSTQFAYCASGLVLHNGDTYTQHTTVDRPRRIRLSTGQHNSSPANSHCSSCIPHIHGLGRPPLSCSTTNCPGGHCSNRPSTSSYNSRNWPDQMSGTRTQGDHLPPIGTHRDFPPSIGTRRGHPSCTGTWADQLTSRGPRSRRQQRSK